MEGNEADTQKDSVIMTVRKNKAGIYLRLAISIVEDMFQDYCEGEI